MNTFRAELVKLRRSLSWVVVIVLPTTLMLSGLITSLFGGEPLDDGWHTLWLRSVVFYGMFPIQVGIAILASLVWRVEHRNGNWNALMGGPTASWRILAAKSGAVAVLGMAMQVVAVASMIMIGTVVFQLPGTLPGVYFAASGVIMIACVPLAALQSWLSMTMRSFAAPVGVAFLAAAASMAMLVVEVDGVVFVSPYALVSRAAQLGTATFADTGAVTAPVVLPLVATAAVMTAVALLANTAALERSDTRT